jgi:hypothetical protein
LAPLGSATHVALAQQSSVMPQMSPVTAHVPAGRHRPTPAASTEQRPAQQSMSRPQISPATRHPSSSAQRIATHSVPQQSGSCMHASPAGLHMGPGGGGGGPIGCGAGAGIAHDPLTQSLLQQSMFWAQRAPTTAQAGLSAHWGAPVSARATHARAQHWPAKEHAVPGGRHPFV